MITLAVGISAYLLAKTGMQWIGAPYLMMLTVILDAGVFCFIAYCFGKKTF